MSFQNEKIENWVSDFCHSDSMQPYTGVIREYAPEVLSKFLIKACELRNIGPEQIEVQDLSEAFYAALLGLPASVTSHVPNLLADFLQSLTQQGRLADGETLALSVKCMKAEPAQKTIKRPGSKLNRNDPCPCGSGQKYKKCCMNLLG